MTPINGKCRMTREERNARRRELNANPFHRALNNKVRRAWHAAHREEQNAKARAKYWADPELREKSRKARRANAEANKEREKACWKAWYLAHRDEVCAKQRERTRTEKGRAYMIERNRMRQERLDSDPEYRARYNAARNEQRKRRLEKLKKNPVAYEAYMMKRYWAKKFEAIAGDSDAIRSFMRNTNDVGRRAFAKWYSKIDRTTGLGRIVQPADELVERR